MSIGELVNLYKDGDLEINPAFQRFFRWSVRHRCQAVANAQRQRFRRTSERRLHTALCFNEHQEQRTTICERE